jgi:hypothetical protein
LKKSEKHAEELEAKLKAAEEVFKGARAQATTKEEEWEEEKSKMATRERLEAFNASIISKFKYSLVAISLSFPFLSFIFIGCS